MSKSLKKIVIMAVLAVICVSALVGCGKQEILPRPQADEGVTPIEITGDITYTLNEGVLTVNCKTDIMDGATVTVTIDAIDGTNVDSKEFEGAKNEFSTEFKVTEDWPEIVYATYVCTSKDQPDEITDAYGKKFQNITGEDVMWNTDGCFFAVQTEKIAVK